jgi:hypothetical protein
MKKTLLFLFASFLVLTSATAQAKKSTKKVIKKSTKVLPTVKKVADIVKPGVLDSSQVFKKVETVSNKDTTPVSTSANTNNTATTQTTETGNSDVVSGLKEALNIGTANSAKKLNKLDGFFADAAIKILMPEEAQKVEKTLRGMGMGKLVDDAVLSMNRAAEDASGGIGNIFIDAIKQIKFADALQILRGGDFAATNYLKTTTTLVLTEKFRPVIENSLGKGNATKYWNDIFSTYNKFSMKPVNTDLAAYVTEKALAGLFYNIGLEEQKIRKDPVAQVTNLLKNVFGKKN